MSLRLISDGRIAGFSAQFIIPSSATANAKLGLRSRSARSILAARSKSSKRCFALDQWLSKEQERALSDGTKNPMDC